MGCLSFKLHNQIHVSGSFGSSYLGLWVSLGMVIIHILYKLGLGGSTYMWLGVMWLMGILMFSVLKAFVIGNSLLFAYQGEYL